jgi:hypothetical protein
MSGYDHMFPNLPGTHQAPLPSTTAGQPLVTRVHEAVAGMVVGFKPHRHRLTDWEAAEIARRVMELLDEAAGEMSAVGLVDATEDDR